MIKCMEMEELCLNLPQQMEEYCANLPLIEPSASHTIHTKHIHFIIHVYK